MRGIQAVVASMSQYRHAESTTSPVVGFDCESGLLETITPSVNDSTYIRYTLDTGDLASAATPEITACYLGTHSPSQSITGTRQLSPSSTSATCSLQEATCNARTHAPRVSSAWTPSHAGE